MSAAELREAAALMRQRAAAADKFAQAEGWWQPTPLRQAFSAFVGEGETLQGADEDAEHIASWHPAVALAVADWLDLTATDVPPDPHDDDEHCETCDNIAAAFAAVRDGRDGYGHHRLELALEVTRRSWRKPGIHLRLGDRWSETPIDGSLHGRNWSAFFSVGGVGNRLAHWLTNGEKRDLRIGADHREDAA